MSNKLNTTRRQFLRLSTLGLAGSAVLATSPATLVAEVNAAQAKMAAKGERPTKIIFLVSDGMSQGVVSLTELFSLQVRKRGTYFAELLKNPKCAHGHFETYSLDSFVTDSAAAGSAWGCGSRVMNGALNMFPDGTELTPIFHIAKEKGWGTGVVTTTTVPHATPASFTVSHPARWEQDAIAEKYLNVADIALGGGSDHFTSSGRSDDKDLVAKFKKEGYTVLDDRDGLIKLTGTEKKVLGTFHTGSLPYTVDHINDPELVERIPTLAEMTDKAIKCLESNHSDGWILQVEGARIDHAAHANDAAGVIWDQVAFDDAVGVALEFAARHPETLVVVTTDHGNANPGLSSYGGSTNEMFERIALAKASTGVLRSKIRNQADSPADIHEAVKDLLGLDLEEDHVKLVSRMLKNDFSMVVHNQHRNFNGAFNNLLANYNGIGWVSTQHTEDYVILAATGPMQDRFNKLIKNTDAFGILAEAMGSTHRNKVMTLEEARQHASLPLAPIVEDDIVHT
ncbi:MAG: alkaline phosphatase [Candidatus Sumerlaeia bacterium]|nr:alkaline phosphatase [Candidatus Sumerlaeia bacterium]